MKKLIKHILKSLGWNLMKDNTGYTFSHIDSPGWHHEYLSKLCKPKTVIDVGVGYGTPELYKAYPDAFFALCEPLVEYNSHIAKHLKEIDGKLFHCAIGAEERTTAIQVDKEILQRSSLHKRSALTATGSTLEEREIAVRTLDNIMTEESLEPPFLLKIDTEGFELEVVKGATELLKNTMYVISEVSVASRFEGSYTFYDFVQAMHDQGFELFNVLHVGQRRDRAEAGYMDIIFKRATT